MNKKPTFLLISIFLILFSSLGFGQVEITLQLSPTLEYARVVYIASFDMLKQGASDFLFQLTIRSDADEHGYLVFSVLRNDEVLAKAITNEFTLPSGITNINNIQLSNGYVFPQTGERVQFDDSQIISPDDDFEIEAGQSGKLPAGTYNMNVEFFYTDGREEVKSEPAKLEIVSSAYAIPVVPGKEGGLSDPGIIYTEFPVFQFNTDLMHFTNPDEAPFQVRVYKVLPDQHLTVDDVLSTTPHLALSTQYTLFQYPLSAEDNQGILNIEEYQPMDPGTYLWRVIITLQTNAGTEYIQSPVFGFKLVDPNSVSEDLVKQAAATQVFNILRYLIGERATQIENELSDFTLQTIMIDGQPVELDALYGKMNQYVDKFITVEYLEVLSSQE